LWPWASMPSASCDHAVAEVDAVDHHHRQIQLADGPCKPLCQLLLAELHEAARDSALGRRARLVRRWHRLLGAGIAPGRHARGDGRHRGGVQRVAAGGPLEAAQRQFALGRRACSWASYGYALAAQHDLAGGGAAAHGASGRVRHALGTAQCDPVGFHHRRQHLLARVNAQAQEGVANIAQNALHGQRYLNLRSRHGPQCGLRVRLHLGGSFGCLRGNPHARACGSKEPPPQLTRSTDSGTSPIRLHGPVWPSQRRSNSTALVWSETYKRITKGRFWPGV
jgi:hypothetical protein